MNGSPHIRVVLDGAIPVYRQIVDQVRTFCVECTLQPGQSLPSVRQLAASLGVHFNTVAEAYRALAEEGWLDVKQGRSVRIVDRAEPRQPTRTATIQHSARLRNVVAELRAQGLSAKWIRNEIETALEGGS